MLQSTSPELSIKSGKSATSSSRRKKDAESLQTGISPDTAPVQSIDIPAAATAPIALPTRSRQEELQDDGRSAQLSTTYEDHTYIPIHNSAYHRPPRMPLPIAEMPDSPSLGPETISKTDSDVPIFTHDVGDSVLPRRNSIVSMDTQDEDDVGEELQPFGAQYTSETIPYTIYWRQPAKQVFVTGTFVAWDRKLRMKQSETDPNIHSTVVPLPAGTHHLKFFVDNVMMVTPDLPTAVDFNNILVNYIEISTDDIPAKDSSSARRDSHQVPQKQVPYPVSPRPDSEKQLGDGTPVGEVDDYSGTVTPGEKEGYQGLVEGELPPEEIGLGDFRQLIPQALIDIDYPEDDDRWKDASRVISEAGNTPSLPLFLSRSILNGSGEKVGVKDDSSVLAFPNHTVLNHLMTSNVKNGVLATAVTTRYKKKYVTTISFKPVPKQPPFGQ
ncbi:galactose metabolism-related protein [Lithohypha guttulata]|uniref:Galactose metabolism- protein n=1 Tax=Lithohypha guttulata TaxID=1690604 RepID=A0AAN7YD21_9EURO|nr:galactose metabolism- protein [Lithohypha guttulata]KAK5088980.1 galactose metabolism- protein [Lithohypha guttulata]